MDIKRKTRQYSNLKKTLFLDISSTNTDTLVPSLYQCVETRSISVLTVAILTTETNMRVCYLDCHEAGLCCYIVIHIETLLHPLQLFYFHL
jgi:hypothetical protein